MLNIIIKTLSSVRIKAAGYRTCSLLFFFLLSACATGPQTEQLLSEQTLQAAAHIDNVPFIPQQEYQCGPAALAMVLRFRGIDVDSEQLKPQVYLPGRKGSLQIEILAATRRYQRIPYVINPRLQDLLREVAAGNPVLVLQNLGLQWAPRWHYAVVVGYDLGKQIIILHSGTDPEHQTSLTTFERTWQRSGMWGIVITAPEQVPISAVPERFINAVETLQDNGDSSVRRQAYLSATRTWPEALLPRLALGNNEYEAGDLAAAEQSFRIAVEQHPDSVMALNNLAQTLADLQRTDEALTVIRQAASLGGPFAAIVRQTQQAIEQQLTSTHGQPPPPRH